MFFKIDGTCFRQATFIIVDDSAVFDPAGISLPYEGWYWFDTEAEARDTLFSTFVPPPLSDEEKLLAASNAVRTKRDQLLLASDKLVFPDLWFSYTPSRQQAISAYRQALRDIPQQAGFPWDVIWPQEPV